MSEYEKYMFKKNLEKSMGFYGPSDFKDFQKYWDLYLTFREVARCLLRTAKDDFDLRMVKMIVDGFNEDMHEAYLTEGAYLFV